MALYFAEGTPWSSEEPDWVELLELVTAGPDWHADALCREHPDVEFFPEKGEPAGPAKQVCAGCLVRAECQEWAIVQGPGLQGVWGGLSWKQRQEMRRPRAAS